MKAECPSEAQQLSSATINTLPQTIIETILCLIPIQEAARTSILSREWRYKWTTIPKLDFGWPTVSEITKKRQPSDRANAKKNMDPKFKLFNAIQQVLLMHRGSIHEFTFCTIGDCSCFELDLIILHLSTKHAVKKLTLEFDYENPYKLPSCAFSLHQLTDLHLCSVDLCSVDLRHQPIFSGFGSLRSLCLYDVSISTEALLDLLSNCPSLKRLSLHGDIGWGDCTIIELFECLPMIEHLTIYVDCAKWLVLDSVPKELPTSLIHLKHLCCNEMSFSDNRHLTFLVVLIKCSPNLEKIELEVGMLNKAENEICSGILEKYSDVWLEHLKELEIEVFTNLKHEMEFLKFILARSPKLKKVILCGSVVKDEESDMLKVLLQAPRASQVEINFKNQNGLGFWFQYLNLVKTEQPKLQLAQI